MPLRIFSKLSLKTSTAHSPAHLPGIGTSHLLGPFLCRSGQRGSWIGWGGEGGGMDTWADSLQVRGVSPIAYISCKLAAFGMLYVSWSNPGVAVSTGSPWGEGKGVTADSHPRNISKQWLGGRVIFSAIGFSYRVAEWAIYKPSPSGDDLA